MNALLEGPPPLESGVGESDRQLRTQFLRRVAHDIASPTGVTMTVLDELATAGQPRPELVAMARRSLKRLMRLSEQLALCAELEGGALDPERATSDLRQVTKQAHDDAIAIDGRKDVTAACSLPDGAVVVSADARLLTAMLREVIGNALKLACSKVNVSLQVVDGVATIRVEDDGPGFGEDALATLGQRFVRRSASRGLGLSLSMAKEIVAMHDGELRVEKSTLLGRRGTPGGAVVVTLTV